MPRWKNSERESTTSFSSVPRSSAYRRRRSSKRASQQRPDASVAVLVMYASEGDRPSACNQSWYTSDLHEMASRSSVRVAEEREKALGDSVRHVEHAVHENQLVRRLQLWRPPLRKQYIRRYERANWAHLLLIRFLQNSLALTDEHVVRHEIRTVRIVLNERYRDSVSRSNREVHCGMRERSEPGGGEAGVR